MTRRRLRSHARVVPPLLLCACAAEPPARAVDAPGIVTPAAWTAAADPTAPAADSPAPDAPDVAPWWRAFDDPRLDELIAAATADNRDLQAAVARFAAATATVTIAGAEGEPQTDAGFDANRARRLFLGFPFGSGGVPSSTATTFGLSLNVSWEIDLWGRIRANEGAALADAQAAAADLAAALLSLQVQTCRAYFAVVETRQQLDLAEATAAAFRATVDDVRDRYRRGVRPALDVHQAATNLANAEAIAVLRKEQLQAALRRLDVLTGRYPSGAAATAARLPRELPAVPLGLPADLLRRRPDLAAAERRLAADGCRVDAARAALYPRLALTASGGTASTELEDLVDDDFRIWSLGANLLQPLLRGGALRAEVRRREAFAAEALAAYGGTVLAAFAEVESSLANDALLVDRRAALVLAADHARTARDLARERWQRGLTDFLAVADGQRQSFLTDAALIAVDRQRLDNRLDLILALGGGFDADAAFATGSPE